MTTRADLETWLADTAPLVAVGAVTAASAIDEMLDMLATPSEAAISAGYKAGIGAPVCSVDEAKTLLRDRLWPGVVGAIKAGV